MNNPRCPVYLYGFVACDNAAGLIPVYSCRRKVRIREIENTDSLLDGTKIKRKHSSVFFLNTSPTTSEAEMIRFNPVFRRKLHVYC